MAPGANGSPESFLEKNKQAGVWVGVKHCSSAGLVFLGSLQLSSAITTSEPDQLCQNTERAISTKPLKYPLKVDLLESVIYFSTTYLFHHSTI